MMQGQLFNAEALRQYLAPVANKQAFLTWRPESSGDKLRKVPYYADGGIRQGDQGGPADRARLVTLEEAMHAAAGRGVGVGVALLPDTGLVALDLDHCVSEAGTTFSEAQRHAGRAFRHTYREQSPSGTGIRMLALGAVENVAIQGEVELFGNKGFVTLTGHRAAKPLALITPEAIEGVRQAILKAKNSTSSAQPNPSDLNSDLTAHLVSRGAYLHTPENEQEFADALRAAWPRPDDRDEWRSGLCATAYLNITYAWPIEVCERVAREWSELSSRKYSPGGFDVEWCDVVSRTAQRIASGQQVLTERTVFAKARANGWVPRAVSPPAISSSSVPQIAQQFQLMTGAELLQRPPLQWRVKGVLPERGIGAIYGPSGSGKTFLVLDMACAIAEGSSWFGYRVNQTPVVYCAFEGESGIANRARAWSVHHGRPIPDSMRFMMQRFDLFNADDVPALAVAINEMGGAGVVFLDTLNRAASGMDENDSSDMGRVIQAAKDLQNMIGGIVVLVHHTGKDTTRGMRGHSSLIAALDSSIEVARDGVVRTWEGSKVKDGQDGASHPFVLEIKALGNDVDGDPITSCAVEPCSPATIKSVKPPKGPNQVAVLSALRDVLNSSTDFGRGGAPAMNPCVQFEVAVAECGKHLAVEEKRRAERAASSLRTLAASGHISHYDGWVWIP